MRREPNLGPMCCCRSPSPERERRRCDQVRRLVEAAEHSDRSLPHISPYLAHALLTHVLLFRTPSRPYQAHTLTPAFPLLTCPFHRSRSPSGHLPLSSSQCTSQLVVITLLMERYSGPAQVPASAGVGPSKIAVSALLLSTPVPLAEEGETTSSPE
jgi:hypothetical protein